MNIFNFSTGCDKETETSEVALPDEPICAWSSSIEIGAVTSVSRGLASSVASAAIDEGTFFLLGTQPPPFPIKNRKFWNDGKWKMVGGGRKWKSNGGIWRRRMGKRIEKQKRDEFVRICKGMNFQPAGPTGGIQISESLQISPTWRLLDPNFFFHLIC